MTPSPDWLTRLPAAADASQLVVAAGIGPTTITLSMHEKDESGLWRLLLSTPGFMGVHGLGKQIEGDGKTPVGVFPLTEAFGNHPDPGCQMPYTQVDGDFYWSGDHRPGMQYNRMVRLSEYPALDTANSEHLIDYGDCYAYCLNIGYNLPGTPGLGSAIFFHCFGPVNPYTAGCVAIPIDKMRQVMQLVKPGCLMVIDSAQALGLTP